MTKSDLREMLLAEQEQIRSLQRINLNHVYLGAHSGTLGVTFAQPRTDPITDTGPTDRLVRAQVTMQKLELWPDAIDWSGESDCTQLFQATLERRPEDTGNSDGIAKLKTTEQEFCFAMQARQWVEETVPHFDAYPVEVVNGCEVSDSFAPHLPG